MSALTLFATHSTLTSLNTELKLPPDLTIGALKKKLMSFCGTDPAMMHLSLLDAAGVLLGELADDSATLEAVGAVDGCKVHITDLDPASALGDADDLAAVPKVELSDEAAAERKEKFSSFKTAKAKPVVDEEHMAELAAPIAVGTTCEVAPGGKRGTVRYVGKIPEIAPGWWVGVEYNEPVGKNDGSVKGTRYFTCAAETGGFVRPDKAMGTWSDGL